MVVNNGYQIPDLGSDPWNAPINTTMEQITNVLPPAGTTHVTTEHDHGKLDTVAGSTVVAVVGSGSTGIVNLPNIPPNRFLVTDAGRNIIGVTGISSFGVGETGIPTANNFAIWTDPTTITDTSAVSIDYSGDLLVERSGGEQIAIEADAQISVTSVQMGCLVQGQQVVVQANYGSVPAAILTVGMVEDPRSVAYSNCALVKLGTIDNVDLTSGGLSNPIWIAPGSEWTIVTEVVLRATTINNVTVVPYCSVVSISSPTFEIFDSRQLGNFGYDQTQNGYRFIRNMGDATTDTMHIMQTGESVYLSVDSPATATALVVSVDLFGYVYTV